MANVLMLCYYYPPLGGIGSQRSQKFACYLQDYGWHPIVLTPRSGSYLIDDSLDDGSSRGVEVVRTPYVDLSSNFKRASLAKTSNGNVHSNGNAKKSGVANLLRRAVRTWVYIPDGQIGWYPFAVRAGRRAIETKGADAIYSSSFPVTAHMAACRLKLATGRPWIADFRDLWTENHYADYSSAMRKRLDQIMESDLLDNADVIITVSNTWADTLRKLTGGRKRVEVIRNGFDASEFGVIERRCPDKWTITYIGNFYGAKQDPTVFFNSLARVIRSGRVSKEDTHLRIVGEPDSYAQEVASRAGLADITSFTGFVSHGQSLAHQVNSSMLLMILHGDKSNPGHVPGKLYEYLGARRPILAIMPSGFEAARIIREAGAGVSVEPADEAGIDRCLIDSYSQYKCGAAVCSAGHRDLSPYERKYGAKQLANILTELRAD